jgi:hypothetical protein
MKRQQQKHTSKPLAVMYVRSWAPWETDSLERTMTEATQWGEAYRACEAKIEELGAVLVTDELEAEFNDHAPGDTLERERLHDLLSFVSGRFDITYVVIHCPACLSTDLTQRRGLLGRLNASITVVFVDDDDIAHYGDETTMKSKNERRAA